jgi:hypothetical protein
MHSASIRFIRVVSILVHSSKNQHNFCPVLASWCKISQVPIDQILPELLQISFYAPLINASIFAQSPVNFEFFATESRRYFHIFQAFTSQFLFVDDLINQKYDIETSIPSSWELSSSHFFHIFDQNCGRLFALSLLHMG